MKNSKQKWLRRKQLCNERRLETFRAVAVDMAKVRQRKRTMVERLIEMHLQRYKASGAENP